MKNYKKLESELNQICLNRVDEIHAMILAHVSRTHLVMLGVPGTAKSMMVRKFAEAFPTTESATTSIPYFEIPLNELTQPAEVFGPIDMKKWKNDTEIVYKTDNFLPNARIAFIDELSRGETVLNTLLTIINERVFNVNGVSTPVPLDMCVSATNFKLENVQFEALRDRFLQWVNPKKLSTEDDRLQMWLADDKSVSVRISEAEVAKCRSEVDAVKLDVDVLKSFNEILITLEKELGIILSDRRTRMMIKLIKASAWYNGHTKIETEDLKDIWTACWTNEQDIPKVKALIKRIADHQAYVITEVFNDVMSTFTEWNKGRKTIPLTQEAINKVQMADKKLKKLGKIKSSNMDDYTTADKLIERANRDLSEHKCNIAIL